MGAWPFVLLSLILVVMTTGEPGSVENENDKPCLSWTCARKRALLLRNRFLNAERAAHAETAIKKSSVVDADEAPCLTWQCKRKRRALNTQLEPAQLPSDGEPCLTRDCRTGKRSLKKRSIDDYTALTEKLRLFAPLNEKRNAPGCIAWHCNGKRR